MAVAAAVRLRGLAALLSPSSSLCGTVAAVQHQPKCGIVSKSLRDDDYKRPAPFPYETKNYNVLRAFFDGVTHRFDENSKIIVIDGPPTGEKTQLAKEVAEELDMLHIPPANLDQFYINSYGFDMRTLNPKMPRSCRTFDIHEFLQCPKDSRTTKMQFELMHIRFFNYVKAIAHVLNTGQGVVMNRSLYSDFVFMETLNKHGFMSDLAKKYYTSCVDQGTWEFMKPHLVIYLDIPVDSVLANIKARNRPYEQKSPFYTPEVLNTLETVYKKEYLKQMSKHSEVLIYDWSEGGEAEVVVEDICRLKLDDYTNYDSQMEDWRHPLEWDWKEKRIWFSHEDKVDEMYSWLNVPRQYVPELVMDGNEHIQYIKVLEETPACRYEEGYNKDMGDKYLFKW